MRKALRHRMILSIFILVFAGRVGAARGQDNNSDSGRRKLPGIAHSNEIHVDQDCRIHETVPHTGSTKQHIYRNRGICDVSDIRTSSRDETDVEDGSPKHLVVVVREHTFNLHNPSSEPVTFFLSRS